MSTKDESEQKELLIEEKLEIIDSVLRHIKNVSDNCNLLGRRLIESGEIEIGVGLIANGLIHDNSKLRGIELLYLHPDTAKTKFALAISHHVTTNPHHPEYWCGIENMPDIYLCEMICDWKARSEEFGTSIHDWVNKAAAEKFGYKKNSEVCKKIARYISLLCDKPF